MYEIKYRDKEEFKNIDIDDYTEIPKDWDIIRTGILFRLGRGRVISKEEILDNKGEYPVYSSQTANNGILGYINTYDFKGEYITWTTDGANAGTVFKRTGKFNCTNVCGTLKPEKNLDLGYIAYILSTVTRKNVRIDINPKLMNTEMSSIKILFPKIYEQEKISNFLDYKTSQFDSIIEKKEKLIEKLEEAKKSLISEVITGKVKIVDGKLVKRDESEMKDSGVEWLGKIPKDWVRSKLKNVLKEKIKDGPHETPDFQDEGIPFLSAEAIVDSKLSFEKKRGYITKEQYKVYKQKSKVNVHDILFCKSGSTTGKAALVETKEEFGIWSPLAIIRTNQKMNYKLLFFFIQSKYFRIQVENYWSFGTQPNIGMDSLENLYVTFSKNKEEQKEIVDILNRRTKNIEHSIKKNKKQINKIKKAKQSLISEAVTGKIDLRDWEIKGDFNERR